MDKGAVINRLFWSHNLPLELDQVVFVIQSQKNAHHAHWAEQQRQDLLHQAASLHQVLQLWPWWGVHHVSYHLVTTRVFF